MDDKLICDIKITKKLYCVKPSDRDYAYFTYFDTDDTSFQSRKVTAKKWASNSTTLNIDGFISNDAIDGFVIDGFTSRSRSENKVFDISDPRGFKFQIQCKNLNYIMQNCVLDKGVIRSKCVLGVSGNSRYLIPTDTKFYNDWLEINNNTISAKDLNINDNFIDISGHKYIYLGKKHYIRVFGRKEGNDVSWLNEDYTLSDKPKHLLYCLRNKMYKLDGKVIPRARVNVGQEFKAQHKDVITMPFVENQYVILFDTKRQQSEYCKKSDSVVSFNNYEDFINTSFSDMNAKSEIERFISNLQNGKVPQL